MPKKGQPAITEAEAISIFATALGAERGRSSSAGPVLVGIGDDAAVLRRGKGELVVSVDACIEHRHFERAWLSAADVGYRSLMAAASDIAAMGARCNGAVAHVTLPAQISRAWVRGVARGQQQAAAELGCPIVGGNISRGAEVSIVTTVFGATSSPLLRSGAQPGDELWLSGAVGLAALGLDLLRAREATPRLRLPRGATRALRAWRRPRALLEAGQALQRRAHAAIDLSDGLAGDARHVADASQVRVVIDECRLRAVMPVELGRIIGGSRSGELKLRQALDYALYGGEDYAVLATGPSRRRPEAAHAIGIVEAGSGVVLRRADGSEVALSSGFDHLAS